MFLSDAILKLSGLLPYSAKEVNRECTASRESRARNTFSTGGIVPFRNAGKRRFGRDAGEMGKGKSGATAYSVRRESMPYRP